MSACVVCVWSESGEHECKEKAMYPWRSTVNALLTARSRQVSLLLASIAAKNSKTGSGNTGEDLVKALSMQRCRDGCPMSQSRRKAMRDLRQTTFGRVQRTEVSLTAYEAYCPGESR